MESTNLPTTEATGERWRAWPGWLIGATVALLVFGPGLVAPGTMVQLIGMLAGPLMGVIGLVMWLTLGLRAPATARWLLVFAYVVLGIFATMLADESMKMGMYLYATGAATAVLATFIYFGRNSLTTGLIGLAIGWGFFTLLRCEGLDGSVRPEFSWRWSQTRDEAYQDQAASLRRASASELVQRQQDSASSDATEEPAPPSDAPHPTPTSLVSPWPGFRGVHRDGHADGSIRTDWETDPPREVWRRPIGAGWSSFILVGPLLYTQEQRGDEELLLCLDAATGDEAWRQPVDTRFWEVIGGAGPRATPTYDDGCIYAMSSNGTLVRVDAVSGEVKWRAEAAKDGKAGVPQWGFAASPLVVNDLVVVFCGGTNDVGSVLAYNKADGSIAWSAGDGKHSYSSPHLASIKSVEQIVMVTDAGAQGLSLDGDLLWTNEWVTPGYRVTQPAIHGSSLYYGTNNGMGMRRLELDLKGDTWEVGELWTSKRLKPYFNDFVVHQGCLYGFDNTILVCLDVATGERKWKGGRYGTGQLILLPQQDLLLVTTETSGEVVLVQAAPDKHTELARHTVLDGKSWNHPVLVDGRLFVRNGSEAVCLDVSANAAADSGQ